MKLKTIVLVAVLVAALNTSDFVHAGNLVTNGGFDGPYINPNYHIKQRFDEIRPYGWSGGDKLTYLCFPGAATVVDNNGGLAVWAAPAEHSPAGGNFVMGDGDPNYSDAIYQVVDNLIVGRHYQVGFYQASGQNIDQVGPTFEQWIVGFGNSTQYSSVMYTEPKGTTPWTHQVLEFVADSTSEKLSFLAYGGPAGGPPVSFLDGITLNRVPEPSSIALSAIGIVGIGLVCLRRRLTSRGV